MFIKPSWLFNGLGDSGRVGYLLQQVVDYLCESSSALKIKIIQWVFGIFLCIPCLISRNDAEVFNPQRIAFPVEYKPDGLCIECQLGRTEGKGILGKILIISRAIVKEVIHSGIEFI